jgi:antitoxin component of MazEF toxin-antitoxin module
MEKFRQVINAQGLQIPLPIMERYGLQPGAPVVLELDEQGIRITPALPAKEEIENLALRYLLSHLGDAVAVEVEIKDTHWHVSIYGTDLPEPLGHLIFSMEGKLLTDQSTPSEIMRQKAIAAYNAS